MIENFDAASFWHKLRTHAVRAGREVVEKALCLFYASQQPQAPAWAKTVIYGALGYFVLPMDAIPDFVPAAGYSDDLGALAAAVATVSLYVDDTVKALAAEKLGTWFA